MYFQRNLDSIRYIQSKEPIIQKNDFLSIQILSASINQDQTLPFNPHVTSSGTASLSGYLVDRSGNVEMPVIGSVKAAGLTQLQLQKAIVERVSPYVKDPSVVVHFLQFKVNVLGEVKSPGTKLFDADRVTIIDAISASGDLTDLGKREDISIIREENNVRKIYKIDMRSGSLFQSPAYLLQANDIVYVGAHDQKFKKMKSESNVSTFNFLRIISTVVGLATSIYLLKDVFK